MATRKPKEWVKLTAQIVCGVVILLMASWIFSIDKTVNIVKNHQDRFVLMEKVDEKQDRRIDSIALKLDLKYESFMSKIETIERNKGSIFKIWDKTKLIDTRIDRLDSSVNSKISSIESRLDYTDKHIDHIDHDIRELRERHLK